MRKGIKKLLVNILTLLMGTAIIVFNGPLRGLMSGYEIRPGCQRAESGNTSRQSCIRIDRYRRDIDCSYSHDEVACNQLLSFLHMLPTACYFDRS